MSQRVFFVSINIRYIVNGSNTSLLFVLAIISISFVLRAQLYTNVARCVVIEKFSRGTQHSEENQKNNAVNLTV